MRTPTSPRARGLALAILLATPLLLAFTLPPEGFWRGTADTPHGAIPMELMISREDGQWVGRVAVGGAMQNAGQDALDLELKGDSIFFDAFLQTTGGAAIMSFTGALTDDVFTGSFQTLTESGDELGRGTWRLGRATVQLPAGGPRR